MPITNKYEVADDYNARILKNVRNFNIGATKCVLSFTSTLIVLKNQFFSTQKLYFNLNRSGSYL